MFWFLICVLLFFIAIVLHFKSVEHIKLQEKYGKEKGRMIGKGYRESEEKANLWDPSSEADSRFNEYCVLLVSLRKETHILAFFSFFSTQASASLFDTLYITTVP
jgi:hypothetical protein